MRILPAIKFHFGTDHSSDFLLSLEMIFFILASRSVKFQSDIFPTLIGKKLDLEKT